jgi:hypothetical protein
MITKTPKLVPKFKPASILKLSNIIELLLIPYTGSIIQTKDGLEMILQEFITALPSISIEAMKETLSQIMYKPLTEELIKTFSLFLAANMSSITAGKPVQPFTCLAVPEWNVIEVIRTLPGKTKSGKLGGKFTFKVLTGRAAGQTFTQILTNKQINILGRNCGFSGRGLKKFDGVRSSLFGMWLAVQLLSVNERIVIKEYAPDRCQSHNRKIIEKRCTKPCDFGLQCRCNECLRGQDQCPRGCRPLTLEVKECDKCNNLSAIFEGEFCLNCYSRTVYEN